jgi:phosphoserine phosphatase RsbU/P
MLRQHFTMRFDERAEVTTIPVGVGITGAAAESRQVIRVNNTLAEPRYLAVHSDIRSEIAVPLVLHDRVIGVMDLESERVGFFTEDHARILSLLAPTMATSIENARLYQELSERERRMDQDLQAAEQVQRMMLRRDPPRIEGLEIAVGLRPAHTISGDVFHFFQFDNDDALITFGDVSGKGVAAALYGALTTGLMSTMAPRLRSPGKLLEALNDLLIAHKVEARYVSLLALAWNSTNHTLAMANAGALPPYIYREGRVIKPKAEGVPLGLLADNRYEEVHFATQPGDLIVLYSDGITDQENEREDEYGRGGLCNHVRTVWQLSPREIVHSIFEDVDRFAGGMERFDDQTLVVMKVT